MRVPRIGLWFAAVIFTPLSPVVSAGDAPDVSGTVTFFYYKDLDAQVPFYEGVLKLTASMNEDWVKIYPITETASVGLVLDGRGYHRVSEDKPAMLSIVTDDVDAWYERIRQSGVPVLRELPPRTAQPGVEGAPVRGFMVEDPGGYTIEFFSWRKTR
jgi:predicted enzyme related to lactoylglutathione lyase